MSARSAQPEVRNPLLALEATQQLLALPAAERLALAALLAELSTEAHAKAELSWRQRKGPMAAYWRAVGVYARHTSRALRRGPAAGHAHVLADVEANGVHLQLLEVPA